VWHLRLGGVEAACAGYYALLRVDTDGLSAVDLPAIQGGPRRVPGL
jgi:hypothetical protein